MFTINNGNNEGNRNTPNNKSFTNMTGSETVSPHTAQTASDATQRIRVDQVNRNTPRRSAAEPVRQAASASASPSSEFPRRRRQAPKKQNHTPLLILGIAAVVIFAIILACILFFAEPEDNGLILNNIYAAGIDIGGKTPEQAKLALEEATANTYSTLDMVVEVHDEVIFLSPEDTKVELDIDAIVKAAYDRGRVGSRSERQKARNISLTSSYVINILPYLNLDEDYIEGILESLGKKYSSTREDPTYSISGNRPNLNVSPEEINTELTYQTITITAGVPEFGLETDRLYDQILEAYNSNIFQVVGDIYVNPPEVLDINALFNEFCVAPVDAELNESNLDVKPSKFGYGFNLEDVKAFLETADYGESASFPMRFLRPDLTEEDLADGLFNSELGYITTPASIDSNLIANLKLACKAINGTNGGMILKNNGIFSFNDIVGQPTEELGYMPVIGYVGKQLQETLGGGLSRLSSALYYCALKADLEILERTAHAFAPNFIEPGLDADVLYGNINFTFKNTTGKPIRIVATVNDFGTLTVRILGTANKSYRIDVVAETLKTYLPTTLSNTMIADNPGNYQDGEVLVQPIVGYEIFTYKLYSYTDTTIPPAKKQIALTHYDKQDMVVVDIESGSSESVPSEPSEPSEPIEPSEPSEPNEEDSGGENP